MTMCSPGRQSAAPWSRHLPGEQTTSSMIDRTATDFMSAGEGLLCRHTAMKITNEVLDGYLNCKTKGHLKLAGEHGTSSDLEEMPTAASRGSREAALAKLLLHFGQGDTSRRIVIAAETLKQGAPLLADSTLENDAMSIRFDALKRTDGTSKLGDHHYVPVLHYHGEKVGRQQKLLLAVLGLVLDRVQGLRSAVGLVARGSEGRLGKVRLDANLYRQAEQVLDELKRLQAGEEPPRLTLNKHCQVCEFRQRCRTQAEKADDISLLGGVGEKELKRYNRKGIFTLTQLACTFRPRKKSKRSAQRTNRQHALHAMAIRDRQIYSNSRCLKRDSSWFTYFNGDRLACHPRGRPNRRGRGLPRAQRGRRQLAGDRRAHRERHAGPASGAATAFRASTPDYDVSCKTGFCATMPRASASSSSVIDWNTKSPKHCRIFSQRCRLLPFFFQAAWNKGQQCCCVWSTPKASIIKRASTTDRFCAPCP